VAGAGKGSTWFAPVSRGLEVYQHVERPSGGRPVLRGTTRWVWGRTRDGVGDVPDDLLTALQPLLAA